MAQAVKAPLLAFLLPLGALLFCSITAGVLLLVITLKAAALRAPA